MCPVRSVTYVSGRSKPTVRYPLGWLNSPGIDHVLLANLAGVDDNAFDQRPERSGDFQIRQAVFVNENAGYSASKLSLNR